MHTGVGEANAGQETDVADQRGMPMLVNRNVSYGCKVIG